MMDNCTRGVKSLVDICNQHAIKMHQHLLANGMKINV